MNKKPQSPQINKNDFSFSHNLDFSLSNSSNRTLKLDSSIIGIFIPSKSLNESAVLPDTPSLKDDFEFKEEEKANVNNEISDLEFKNKARISKMLQTFIKTRANDINSFIPNKVLSENEILPEIYTSIKIKGHETPEGPRKQIQEIDQQQTQKKKARVSQMLQSFYTTRFSNVLNYMTSVVKTDTKNIVHIVLDKFFLPHLLAIALSFLFILLQNQLSEMCFCLPYCSCSNDIWIKLYTSIRSVLTLWLALLILGTYFIDFFSGSKKLTIIMFFYGMFAMGGVYFFTDGTQCQVPAMFGGLFAWSGGCLVFVYVLIKEKFNFKALIKKSNLQTLYMISLIFNRALLGGVQNVYNIIEDKFGETYAEMIFLCFIIIYTMVFKKLIFLLIFKIYKFMEDIKYDDITPLTLMIRIYLCYIVSLQFSNLISKNVSDFGTWLSFIYYATFQFCFYTHLHPSEFVYKWLCSKLKKQKPKEATNDPSQLLFERMIAGYMMEFQLILIPRLLILMIYKHWLTIDYGIFNINCDLETNEKYWVMKLDVSCFLMIFNLGLPVCILLYSGYKKKNHYLDYKVEKKNIFIRAILIFGYMDLLKEQCKITPISKFLRIVL